jgi:hypothetical protein
MPRLVPLNPQRFQAKRFKRAQGFRFAANQALWPVVGSEFGELAGSIPIVFMREGAHYTAMAMTSPVPNKSFYVGPDGEWLGTYRPAILRAYPFRLVRQPGPDKSVLCIDEESGLILDGPDEGEAFFKADGTPADSIKAVLQFLSHWDANCTATELALAALAEAGVIEPWPLQINLDGKPATIEGICRIAEAKLNAVGDEKFLQLRKAGALALAYAQLISMRNVGRFSEFAKLRKRLQSHQPEFNVDEIFRTGESDIIKFD